MRIEGYLSWVGEGMCLLFRIAISFSSSDRRWVLSAPAGGFLCASCGTAGGACCGATAGGGSQGVRAQKDRRPFRGCRSCVAAEAHSAVCGFIC